MGTARGARPGFWDALRYPFLGLAHLVRTPRLWKYAALPFAINLVVYTLLAVALYGFVQNVLIGAWMAKTWTWLKWMAAVAAYLAGAVLLAFSFTIVGNIIAAPLLDFLAERALTDLRGRPLPAGGPWLAQALFAVGRQVVKLALFGAVQLALLLLVLVPVVGLAHPVLSALVTVGFLALEYLEYPQIADRMPLGARLGFLSRHAGPAFGFGAALLVLALIPLVGYFALPGCVLGATLLYRDLRD
jgi:CysZ protein